MDRCRVFLAVLLWAVACRSPEPDPGFAAASRVESVPAPPDPGPPPAEPVAADPPAPPGPATASASDDDTADSPLVLDRRRTPKDLWGEWRVIPRGYDSRTRPRIAFDPSGAVHYQAIGHYDGKPFDVDMRGTWTLSDGTLHTKDLYSGIGECLVVKDRRDLDLDEGEDCRMRWRDDSTIEILEREPDGDISDERWVRHPTHPVRHPARAGSKRPRR